MSIQVRKYSKVNVEGRQPRSGHRGNLINLSVVVTKDQYEWLNFYAERYNITISELVRRALCPYYGKVNG